MERLSDDVLRAALDDGRSLALVLVLSTSVSDPGTMSESLEAELAVEQVLLGQPAPRVSAWTWSHPNLVPGHRYLVVFGGGFSKMGPGGREKLALGAILEVSHGAEAEAVRVHGEALERLRKQRKQD